MAVTAAVASAAVVLDVGDTEDDGDDEDDEDDTVDCIVGTGEEDGRVLSRHNKDVLLARLFGSVAVTVDSHQSFSSPRLTLDKVAGYFHSFIHSFKFNHGHKSNSKRKRAEKSNTRMNFFQKHQKQR